MTSHTLRALAIGLVAVLGAPLALAQPCPEKSVMYWQAFPPGGESDAAQTLMQAIESVTADPALHTADLGGTARTADVTRAVCQRLAA